MSSLKRSSVSFFAVLFVLCFAASAFAQITVPRPSQSASVMQRVGVTDITITYSRPGVKGRKIWGDPLPGQEKGEATLDNQNERPKGAPIVPWGHVWRTGANEATTFTVTDDVLINGQKLAAGIYSLHTNPTKDEWTIVFNGTANQWGSFSYDEKKDVLRVKTKPQMATDNQEWLLYTFDPVGDNSAQVNLRWEKLRVPFTVEVKDVKALTVEKLRSAVAAAKPDDWRTPLQAANYVFTNNIAASNEEAMQWLDKSLKTKETFGNLYTKARVLAATGKAADAVATGEKALTIGKAPNSGIDPLNIADLEKRMAEWKSKQ